MALALYRKYRPATFAEVVGQEHVTGPLMTAVDSGRINHAYLFSGPRGCGKTSSARILARSLNCEQGPTSGPCGACQSCIDLAPDGSGNIDVIEIDAASHGGVDDARELRERAFQLPVHSRYKIYIIDEAHMVSNQGFNALLKVVEEPPESVVFIFATTEPDKVLPTIRSRTHHYPFRLVPPAAMRDLLERNCASEGVQVGSAVLPLVVRAGGGSVRDSQSLLDQLISGAGSAGITYEEALALLGVTDAALLDDMVEAVGVGDGATVFGTVNRLIDAGHDPRRFGADLLDRLRDLILMSAVPDAGEKGLIDAPVDHVERLAGQASRLGLPTLSRLADIVHAGLTEMRGTTAPRLGLELICARMLLPAASDDAASVTQRVERLERRMEIGGLPAGDSSARTGDGRARTGAERDRGAGSRPGAAAPGHDRPAGAITPRQRAEAEFAARAGSRPEPGTQATPSSPAAAPEGRGVPGEAADEVGGVGVAGHAGEHEVRGAAGEVHRADREIRRAADRTHAATVDEAGSPSAVPSDANAGGAEGGAADPARSPDVAEAGWPAVKAPGSGRVAGAPPVPSPRPSTGSTGQHSDTGASAPPPGQQPAAQVPATPQVPEVQVPDVQAPDVQVPEVRSAEPRPAAEPPDAARVPGPPLPQRTTSDQAQSQPAQSEQPRPTSTDFDVAEVRRQWRGVVDVIKRSSRATAALVETATPVMVRGGTLVINVPAALVRRLTDPQQQQPLKAALQDLLGVTWAIEVTDGAPQMQDQGGAPRVDGPPQDDDEDFAPDPEDETVAGPSGGLDPGQAAVSLLRDELDAQEIVEP